MGVQREYTDPVCGLSLSLRTVLRRSQGCTSEKERYVPLCGCRKVVKGSETSQLLTEEVLWTRVDLGVDFILFGQAER